MMLWYLICSKLLNNHLVAFAGNPYFTIVTQYTGRISLSKHAVASISTMPIGELLNIAYSIVNRLSKPKSAADLPFLPPHYLVGKSFSSACVIISFANRSLISKLKSASYILMVGRRCTQISFAFFLINMECSVPHLVKMMFLVIQRFKMVANKWLMYYWMSRSFSSSWFGWVRVLYIPRW